MLKVRACAREMVRRDLDIALENRLPEVWTGGSDQNWFLREDLLDADLRRTPRGEQVLAEAKKLRLSMAEQYASGWDDAIEAMLEYLDTARDEEEKKENAHSSCPIGTISLGAYHKHARERLQTAIEGLRQMRRR